MTWEVSQSRPAAMRTSIEMQIYPTGESPSRSQEGVDTRALVPERGKIKVSLLLGGCLEEEMVPHWALHSL
jgi:hypothetical protein